MTKIRAEILKLDRPNTAAARIVITSTTSDIFDVLANPRAHVQFDGSETLKRTLSGPERLFLGAKFGMSMRIKLPYRVTNTVVAFEEGRLITWCHFMKWTWSYELLDLGQGAVQVTESFDAHNVGRFSTWWLKKTGAMAHNPQWMAKSLVRLKLMCEA